MLGTAAHVCHLRTRRQRWGGSLDQNQEAEMGGVTGSEPGGRGRGRHWIRTRRQRRVCVCVSLEGHPFHIVEFKASQN